MTVEFVHPAAAEIDRQCGLPWVGSDTAHRLQWLKVQKKKSPDCRKRAAPGRAAESQEYRHEIMSGCNFDESHGQKQTACAIALLSVNHLHSSQGWLYGALT